MPQPGVAESWDISDDETVYTFHLRRTALWSNGEQISAGDCVYGIQRTLNPVTAHRYAYQAWYLKNGKRYSSGLAGVEPSNPVEVELNLPKSAPWTRRGEVLYGKLIAKPDGDDRTVVVEIDGQQRRFVIGDNARNLPEGVEPCRQVLLDFREVGVEAIDNRTVRMTLESATPFWLQLLTHYALFPLFRPCIEEHGSPEWTEPENIVGNGAFRLQFRRIRDRIRFVKSETYWDHENVRLEVVDALSVDSRTTAFNMYETGQIDWATDTESLIVKELLRQDRDELDINPSPFLCTYFYGFNLNVEPLDDIRVRQALSLAIDRQEITATATGAGEIPAYSLVPPGIPGYVPAECEREDPEKARRLLAEAGYADGIGFPKLEIVYNSDETHQTIAELVRKQWQRNLGINVTMRNEEWGSYLNSQRQKKYDIIRRSWVGDYMDANTYIDMWVTGGENNRTDWGNPEYDRLVAAAAAELDDQIRLDLLHDAEAILMDEMPIMPMYYYVSRNLVRPYVRGIYNTMLDLHPLYAIYIDHDDPGPNEYMATSPHFRGKSAQEPAEVGP
jgi:oligopeptide transport system substrate-binding protein